ncbi:MAG: hypothetical protein JW803_08580 [Endomicrobiales bacterium]|nr:hypothetical protein [Endomicrobiales bacterium]
MAKGVFMGENLLLEKLSNDENEMVKNSYADYGDIYNTTSESVALLLECFESFDPQAIIFVQFLSQVRSSLALAFLSCIRRHEVQTYMMLRQALESAMFAAYGLHKPDFKEHGEIMEDGTIDLNDTFKNKVYKWIEEEFPKHSESTKRVKNQINKRFAHANLINSDNTFEDLGHGFNNYYFDKKDSFFTTTQMWLIADIAIGLLLFFSDVLKQYPLANFIDGFDSKANRLLAKVRRFQEKMKKHPRVKRWNKNA